MLNKIKYYAHKLFETNRSRLKYPPELRPALYFYRKSDSLKNFGDELSPVIVYNLMKRFGYSCFRASTSKLLALGSILHFAQDNDIVWGTGINGKIPLKSLKFKKLDVRAVRGPITAEILTTMNIPVPKIYGDPGCILPEFIKKKSLPMEKKFDYVIIPNFNDRSLFEGMKNLVDPTWHWLEVIKHIVNAKFVIASALHGIVIAEAFGIPARTILPAGHAEHDLKYKDYYEGTERTGVKFAATVSQAIKMDGVPSGKPVLKNLISAFPHDLFK